MLQEAIYQADGGETYAYYDGKTIGEIWGYETQGIAQSDQQMQEMAGYQRPETNWVLSGGAGDIMYKDLNGDK